QTVSAIRTLPSPLTMFSTTHTLRPTYSVSRLLRSGWSLRSCVRRAQINEMARSMASRSTPPAISHQPVALPLTAMTRPTPTIGTANHGSISPTRPVSQAKPLGSPTGGRTLDFQHSVVDGGHSNTRSLRHVLAFCLP